MLVHVGIEGKRLPDSLTGGRVRFLRMQLIIAK
jgi:hypothetical protein